jgi:hypothetical protein
LTSSDSDSRDIEIERGCDSPDIDDTQTESTHASQFDSPVRSLRKHIPVRARIGSVKTSDSAIISQAISDRSDCELRAENEEYTMMRAEYIEDRADTRAYTTSDNAEYSMERTAGGTCVLRSSAHRSNSELLDSLLQHRQQQLSCERIHAADEREAQHERQVSVTPNSRSSRSQRSSPSTPRTDGKKASTASSLPSPGRQLKAIRFPKVDGSEYSDMAIANGNEPIGQKCEMPSSYTEDLASSAQSSDFDNPCVIYESPSLAATERSQSLLETERSREIPSSSRSIMDRIRR